MTDSPEARLNAALEGRYRIERELGEGGMATVYLAEDVRHDRKVAVKVLRPELAAVVGAERFLAEIRTTAALQHPHILPLHDSGEADGFLFYVMPYVEGESLRERLDRERQLPVDEAVELARNVADALQYAHEQGVVHRDVKPANILMSRGNPLVADFGIALAVSQAGGGRITETGLSLGTPHYMSPEQASGERTVDRRSDVYSLGCVLYEMLTGEPPHGGPTSQAVLARILTTQPQRVSELRRTVPTHVDAAVAKALEKLPADRFSSVGAFREALEEPGFRHARTGAARTGGAASETAPGTRAGPGEKVWMALTVALVLLAAWGWLRGASPEGGEGRTARLSLDLGELESVEGDVAISPDGTRLAVSAELDGRRSIWIRRMDEADFRRVQGTEDGWFPAFSPDGQWLLFRRDGAETLVRVPVSGGGAVTVLDDAEIDPYLPHWGDGGRIVFTGPQGVHVISETGSGLRPVLSGLQAFSPQLLPGARALVASTFSGPDVHFVDLDADTSWVVVSGARHPRYVATGHLLYVPESGGLFAVPFDPESGQPTGAPSRVLDQVASRPIESRGYDVSVDGTLVHREGTASVAGGADRRFVVLDRDGRADTLGLPAQVLGDVRFSPDGGSIVYETGEPEGHIYTFDLTTGRTTRLTFEGDNGDPIWSPDGTRIAFSSFGGGAENELRVVPADGGEEPVSLLALPGLVPGSWPTPEVIGYHHVSPDGNVDLGTVSQTGAAEPRSWLAAPWNEAALRISPDGRLAAYASQEHGPWQVVLRTFPDPGGSWEVGGRGGTTYGHRWSSDGRFLHYWTVPGDAPGPDPGVLYRVEITGDPPDIRVGEPERILEADVMGSVWWDVHPDGERFVMTVGMGAEAGGDDEARPNERYLVVLDWYTELRERTGRGETR